MGHDSDALPTYLHDHLAGANFAIELLESLRTKADSGELAQLASELLPDIEEDRDTLKRLVDDVGTRGHLLKEAISWFGEKVSEWKFSNNELGYFESLEVLALGVLGKLALWRALEQIAGIDDRIPRLPFAQLATRALDQHSRIEPVRLRYAAIALPHPAQQSHR